MALKTRTVVLVLMVEILLVHGKNNTLSDRSLIADYGCSPPEEWSKLKYNKRTIRNVCLKKDYSLETNQGQVSLGFFDSQITNVDGMKKTITMDVKLFSIWEDPGVSANISKDENFIELPSITTVDQPLLWTPFQSINIYNLKERHNILDPIIMRDFELITSDSANTLLGKNLFPPNITTVFSIVEWSVTVLCNFDFSDFPFDQNICLLKLWATNVNMSLNGMKLYPYLFNQRMNHEAEGFTIKMKPFITTRYLPLFKTTLTGFGFRFEMKRQVRKYLFQYFLPCIAIVIASSFSFIIPLSAIPGRVALVVTQFLTLTNIFIHHMVRVENFLNKISFTNYVPVKIIFQI